MKFVELLKKFWTAMTPAHWCYLLTHLFIMTVGVFVVMLTENPIGISIGCSLIVIGTSGLIMFIRVWLEYNGTAKLEKLKASGIITVFNERSITIKSEYDCLLADMHQCIDIMGFGLKTLQDDYGQQFCDWARKGIVRILLLDPEFPTLDHTIASLRDKEEGSGSRISEDVHSFVKTCSPILKKHPTKFQIRLYRCIPSVNIFRIDDNMFCGPYLIGGQSRKMPTFLLAYQGTLFRRFSEHFDAIWSNNELSRSIPDEWFN